MWISDKPSQLKQKPVNGGNEGGVMSGRGKEDVVGFWTNCVPSTQNSMRPTEPTEKPPWCLVPVHDAMNV